MSFETKFHTSTKPIENSVILCIGILISVFLYSKRDNKRLRTEYCLTVTLYAYVYIIMLFVFSAEVIKLHVLVLCLSGFLILCTSIRLRSLYTTTEQTVLLCYLELMLHDIRKTTFCI